MQDKYVSYDKQNPQCPGIMWHAEMMQFKIFSSPEPNAHKVSL